MKKIVFTLFAIILFANLTLAQNYKNYWYFGNHVGLDFTGGSGIYDPTNSMNSDEASTTISDDNGDLLFYSNSLSIWDRNHLPVTGLMGGYLEGNDNSTQGVTFKDPKDQDGSQDQYYFFYIKAGANIFQSSSNKLSSNNRLYYSIIDASYTTPFINVPVEDVPVNCTGGCNGAGFSEALTAIPHCNGIDYWVVVQHNANLIVYLVNATGVNQHGIFSSMDGDIGTIKSSTDGLHLALASNFGVAIYDFNSSTGTISNENILSSTPAYGISFSPNSDVLYIAGNSLSSIQSFDLTGVNPPNSFPFTGSGFYNMQLAKDGKIYLKKNLDTQIGVINDPNNFNSPNFNPSQISYIGTIGGELGITNFIDAEQPTIPTDLTATTGDCGDVEFSAPCWEGYNFLWDFGDGNSSTLENPTHNYANSGTYNVTATVSLGSVTQTLTGTATALICPTIDCNLPTTQVITNGFSSSSIITTGDVIEINGTFTIDNTVTYNGVKFKMGPNSKIDILNGNTLTLSTCHLFSCTKWWQEITVNTGANLTINSFTIIEDAQQAVHWINGGSVNVTQTIFNRNAAGIYLQGALNAPNINVKSSIFTCRDFHYSLYQTPLNGTTFITLRNNLYNNSTLLHSYGSLIYPAPANTRSFFGVLSDNVEATIGVSGIAKSRNLFDYLDFGIQVTSQANFTVVNNLFSNLTGNNIISMKGVGINANSITQNNIYIGGASTSDGNNFKNCYRGANLSGFRKILFQNNNLENTFTSPNFTLPTQQVGHYGLAVFSSGTSNGYNFSFENNNITNFETGIYINQVFVNYPSNNITIANNTIDADATSSAYCNKGLWVQHIGSAHSGPSLLSVTENTITNCEYNALLFENVAKHLSVTDNTELSVTYNTNNSKQVVRFNNCEEFDMLSNPLITTTNNTTIPSTSNLADFITGIYLQDCYSSVVKCNNIEYVDACATYDQPSDHTHFFNNTMNKAQYGLIVANGAILGPQGDVNEPSGNEWGPYNSSNITQAHTYVYNTANVNTNSPIYGSPNGSTNCTVGTKTLPCKNDEFFFAQKYLSGLFSTTGPNSNCTGVLMTSLVNTTRTLINEAETTTDARIGYLHNKQAFKLIDEDATGSLMQANDLAAFYHDKQNKNIGKLNKIERFIQQQNYAPAKAHLNNFVPENELENNYKSVYEIYINQLMNGTTALIPTENEVLNQIAELCIADGGKPTIMARSILAAFTKNAVAYNDCVDSDNKRLANSVETENNAKIGGDELTKNVEFNVYPNPTNGNFYVVNNLTEQKDHHLTLTDLSGKIIFYKKMNTSSSLKINIPEIKPGLYLLTIKSTNGATVYSKKMSIFNK